MAQSPNSGGEPRNEASEGPGIVKPAVQARSGVISGRVVTILIASLILAAIVYIFLDAYFVAPSQAPAH